MNPLNLQQLSMLSFMRMAAEGAQEVVASEARWGARGQGGGAKRAFILPIRLDRGGIRAPVRRAVLPT